LGGGYACYNVYETSDGKFISIGCLEEKFWQELCSCLGREEFRPDLNAPQARQAEMIDEFRLIFRQKSRRDWLEILDRYDICFSPVNSLAEACEDPQIQARQLWFYTPHPSDGSVPQQAFPIRFSADQPGLRNPPPLLGQHTGDILKELGYSEDDLAELKSHGII